MKRLSLTLLIILSFCMRAEAGYVDHRHHNVDSLETVMAGWTAARLAEASETELLHVVQDLDGLAWGYNNTNRVKSEYYARMMLGIARRMGWHDSEFAAAKCIGQHFWAKEQYDSAAAYYDIAMKAAVMMPVTETGADHVVTYDMDDKDNALSATYGALGNLYSMMDSVGLAMEYYEKAGELFKKHGWHSSSSVLYYNMGETMRFEHNFKESEEYYRESLKYSRMAEDSLAVATACKGLGSLYMEKGRTARAMQYLTEANNYFANHEEEELQFRMECLDYTGQVLELQNRRMRIMIFILAIAAVLAGLFLIVSSKLKKTTKEKRELAEVLEDTVGSISRRSANKELTLKPKEQEILSLIAKGYTNAEVATTMRLSPETIKWYKKKLFVMFEASNSAELVAMARDRGVI